MRLLVTLVVDKLELLELVFKLELVDVVLEGYVVLVSEGTLQPL